MRKLLLASHGPLARAMRETVQMFCGEDSRINVLCAYVDSESMDVEALIDCWEEGREDGDEWVIVTDIYGGSVNNAFMSRLGDQSIRLVAGMSLPLVLEVLVSLDSLDDKGLEDLVDRIGKSGTKLCVVPKEAEADDEF
ncbi:PTS sugar transporter subunit IIA [Collinsella tanakaei]|uniref:PTS EIIA type-4 domain-containing protein n=1 Tax=Collinsella tanakaei YIT 12063 TaxID=742742 RepID=G1WFN1_9ACTN|nr:hypothetical protein [Collinsella tanakaei]EGX68628.1 hypothetical protein HMPREF9452_00144 [Collinsella tanakaei YIT 12063]